MIVNIIMKAQYLVLERNMNARFLTGFHHHLRVASGYRRLKRNGRIESEELRFRSEHSILYMLCFNIAHSCLDPYIA